MHRMEEEPTKMTTKTFRLRPLELMASLLLITGASAVLGAEPPATAHEAPSKEMREKMAAIHEQMASCLRSDKPIADCHAEAMEHCRTMMGKEGCPMMSMGHPHSSRRMMPHAGSESDRR